MHALRSGYVLQGGHGREVHGLCTEHDRSHDADGRMCTVRRGTEDARLGSHQVRGRGRANACADACTVARTDTEPDTDAKCSSYRGANTSTNGRTVAKPNAKPDASSLRRRPTWLR